MRIAIILTLFAGTALAQQAVIPDLEVAQQALAQLAARQAKLAELKAEQAASQAKLVELSKTYTSGHPEIVALRAKLDQLRAQEAALAQEAELAKARAGVYPRVSVLKSPKQTTGGLQAGLPDRWWRNPAAAQSVGLTADQQKKMDDVFQQYRLTLIDLNASLEKEEVILEPLVAAETLDEAKIASQIDRVAQARAELEKANGRMLLGIRKVLTPDQWTKLQSDTPALKVKLKK